MWAILQSADLCHLLKKNHVNVAGMLQLNRNNVSPVTKEEKLKQYKHIAV
jgi:hypothetical protein